MTNADDKLRDAIEHLKTVRDEVKLQIHLGKAELKDELDELEDRWQETEKRLEEAGKEAKEEAKEMAEDAQETMGIVIEELSSAYKRIRERLND